MAIDLFANNASATVSAGGTTAPAAGTSESWTLASVVGLAASTGVTQMRIVDPAAPSEIMLLTNLSGTAATVTRAVEGTTSVAHAAGFTVAAVTTAASLAALVPGDLNIVWPNITDGANMRWGGNSVTANVVGQVTASPYTLLKPCTITSVAIEVVTAGAAGALGYLGFYAAAGNGLPGALLQQSGTVDCTTTGVKTLTLGTPLVSAYPQLIYVAAVFNDATVACRGYRSTGGPGGPGVGGRGGMGDNLPRNYGYGFNWSVAGTLDASPSWTQQPNWLLPNTQIKFSAVG